MSTETAVTFPPGRKRCQLVPGALLLPPSSIHFMQMTPALQSKTRQWRTCAAQIIYSPVDQRIQSKLVFAEV